MVGGPFEPPATEALEVVCNDHAGTLGVVGDTVVFRPRDGEPTALPIRDLVVVTCTPGGRHSVGLPAGLLSFVVVVVAQAPVEVTVALPTWLGVIAWGAGAWLFPAVKADIAATGATPWRLTSQDGGLTTLARELQRRMPTRSRKVTAVEMFTNSARTLAFPGDASPWWKRAFAAWMLVSLPGPALLGALAFAGVIAKTGGSGTVAFAAGLGAIAALGQVALLPGLLLQLPMMWLLQWSGLLRAGVSSPPPEAG